MEQLNPLWRVQLFHTGDVAVFSDHTGDVAVYSDYIGYLHVIGRADMLTGTAAAVEEITRVRHSSLPVSLEFITRVHHSSSSLELVTRACHSRLSLEFITRACHSSLSLEIITRVHHSGLSLELVTRDYHSSSSLGIITRACHSRLSLEIITRVSQVCRRDERVLRIATATRPSRWILWGGRLHRVPSRHRSHGHAHRSTGTAATVGASSDHRPMIGAGPDSPARSRQIRYPRGVDALTVTDWQRPLVSPKMVLDLVHSPVELARSRRYCTCPGS
jgi:hypothetical protein